MAISVETVMNISLMFNIVLFFFGMLFLLFGREGITFMKARLFRRTIYFDDEGDDYRVRLTKYEDMFLTDSKGNHWFAPPNTVKIANGIKVGFGFSKYGNVLRAEVVNELKKLKDSGIENYDAIMNRLFDNEGKLIHDVIGKLVDPATVLGFVNNTFAPSAFSARIERIKAEERARRDNNWDWIPYISMGLIVLVLAVYMFKTLIVDPQNIELAKSAATLASQTQSGGSQSAFLPIPIK